MATKGEETREKILAAAEPMVLQRGFVGTSLDDILSATGLTKGAFFNHFKSKGDLARALVERYARNDFAMFERFAAEAEAEAQEPLDQALLFLRKFEDFIRTQQEPLPGCMFASYIYESVQFDPAIHEFIARGFRTWSAMYEAKFKAALAKHKPRKKASARDLAEMIMSIIEGGFVIARSYGDSGLIARQSRQFRNYLELLFERG